MFLYIVSTVIGLATANAESPYRVTINAKSCADLLSTPKPTTPEPTQLDYAMSDLEGVFVTYLQKIQDADHVEAARLEYFLKDLLSMKAEILNEVVHLLPFVINADVDETRLAEMISSIYQMVDTMGVPGDLYGLKVDRYGNIHFPRQGKRRARMKSPSLNLAPQKEAIGFLGGFAPARDLPENQTRSVGFGKHEIRKAAAPARSVGKIQRSMNNTNTHVLITDGESSKVYSIPLNRLQMMGAQVEGKRFILQFVPEISEWIVKVDNLNNPSGRIGF